MEYKFEVTVFVDEANEQSVIDMVRRTYAESSGVFVEDDNGVETLIPAEEYIDSIEEAVSDLLFRRPNEEAERLGVVLRGVSYERDYPYGQGENDNADALS